MNSTSSAIGQFAEQFVNFLTAYFGRWFDAFSAGLSAVVKLLEQGLAAVPFHIMLGAFVALALWRRGVVFSIFVGLGCV